MKYILNKKNFSDYYSTLFEVESVTNSIALVNNANIIYNTYDVFMKFKPKNLECFLLIGQLGDNIKDFYLDDKIYTYEDVKQKLIDHGITDDNLGSYLNGRVVFPFDNLEDEHILGIKCGNKVSYVGGWSDNIPSDIVILNNFKDSYMNPYTQDETVTWYLNNLQESINTTENLNALSWNSQIVPKKIYLPKNIKKLPNYYLSRISLDKINFNELLDLEYIGMYNYAYGKQTVEPENRETLELDFSNYTKLTIIDEDSFTYLKIKSLILPPNIEYIKSMAFREIYWDNTIITVPTSIKGINNAFYYPKGSYTIKFESPIPPVENMGGTAPLSSFHITVLEGDCYMMVPRGSKRIYYEAIVGDDFTYEYAEEYRQDWLEKIIEYDPE